MATASSPAPRRRSAPTKKTAPLKPAASRVQPAPPPSTPAWFWMVTGVLTGLFVAFIFLLDSPPSTTPTAQTEAPPPPPKAATATKPPAEKLPIPAKAAAKPVAKEAAKPVAAETAEAAPVAAAATTAIEKKGIDFDFYHILPESEVIIPEEELRVPIGPGRQRSNYTLQVGAFRNPGDADSLVAELFLLGLEPRVESALNTKGETWHRVRIGPFDDKRQLDTISRRLQSNQKKYIVISGKEEG
ncbi:MAG: SPOR domain-containing protein [Gammaproteobacteria bacterium]|nr:SPOR domain-containing protein [Gammaproteobacteria bacterium]